uniref:mitochondrial sodium/calcium exchanger protein isoform X4 n=1 Tax=Pristiophorus japonicus TaxID=55135 RepID=UPI00398EC887
MMAGDAAVIWFLLGWTVTCIVTDPLAAAESYPFGTVAGKSEPYSSKSSIFNGSSFSLLLEEGSSGTMECRGVIQLNGSQWCSFVKTTEDCKIDSGFIDYLQGAICGFHHNLLPLPIVLYVIWLVYLFTFLGATAEDFFCPNLAAISASLKLSHNVAGVTFLALGNGAPDVFSAIVAFSDPRTANLAIGALFGAGIFVTTVVAGGVALARPFTVASRPFLRDVIFYMAAVFWTFVVLYFQSIDLGQALGYLALYAVYVFTVIISSIIYKKGKNQAHDSLYSTESEICDTEDANPSCIRRPIHDDSSEYQSLIGEEPKSTKSILLDSLNPIDLQKWRRKHLPWKIFKCLKLPIEILLRICIPVVDSDQEDHNWKRPLNCLQIITGSLVCILTFKSGYYGLLLIYGQFPVWALVLLITLILAALIFFTTKNEEPPKYHCIKHDGLLDWILVGSLGLSLIMSFIFIPVQGFKLKRLYGIILVVYYIMFVVVALLTEANIIHL